MVTHSELIIIIISIKDLSSYVQNNSQKIKIEDMYPYNSNIPQYQGTVRETPEYNPQNDADILYKAMKGLGTNEKMIIGVLCHRTWRQRKEIEFSFKAKYGKDLIEYLKSELSGSFEDVILALMMNPVELLARDLRRAIAGLGTNESTLIDILCTQSNVQMAQLKNTYRTIFNRDLEKDVGDDVSGNFKRLLVSLIAVSITFSCRIV